MSTFTDPAKAGKLICGPCGTKDELTTVPLNPALAPFVPEYDIPDREAGS